MLISLIRFEKFSANISQLSLLSHSLVSPFGTLIKGIRLLEKVCMFYCFYPFSVLQCGYILLNGLCITNLVF